VRLVEWVALGLGVALIVGGVLIAAVGGWSVLRPGSGWLTPILVRAAGVAIALLAAWMVVVVVWLKLRSIGGRKARL